MLGAEVVISRRAEGDVEDDDDAAGVIATCATEVDACGRLYTLLGVDCDGGRKRFFSSSPLRSTERFLKQNERQSGKAPSRWVHHVKHRSGI